MPLVEANGQLGVISGWKVVPGVKTMYNLEVAQDHTFVVGVGQWVVHNRSCATPNGTQFILDETRIHKDGTTILDQLTARGWDENSIGEAIDDAARTESTFDFRMKGDDKPSATAYYHQKGGYVVRADETGEILQVSNRNIKDWKAPWDYKGPS